MTPTDVARIEQFVIRWQNSSGSERQNYQMFFSELCDALGVDRPNVNGSVAAVPYCFDKHITIYHPSGKKTPGYIDFYKADHFLIEAKQGSDQAGKGTAKRGTNAYLKAMEAAFVQAIAYTRNLPAVHGDTGVSCFVCAGDRLHAQPTRQASVFIDLRYWRSL